MNLLITLAIAKLCLSSGFFTGCTLCWPSSARSEINPGVQHREKAPPSGLVA